MTWSSSTSLYVSLKKSTSPRFSATGTSASLPLLSAFLINCMPGIFMRPSSCRHKPQTTTLLSLPTGGHLSNKFLRDLPGTGLQPAVKLLRKGLAVLLVFADFPDLLLREFF